MGVRLGYIVAQRKPKHFIEIGCGLGIHSLTLAKKGINGEAFDLNLKGPLLGSKLASDLGLNLKYGRRDFYKWDPTLEEGTFIIADQGCFGCKINRKNIENKN